MASPLPSSKHTLNPPPLEDIATKLQSALAKNYRDSSVVVERCPDLRHAPFHLATQGLSGNERVADVGGQANLFPKPHLECKYSLLDIAKAMEMDLEVGSLVGAGAGPSHIVGQNCELAPNLAWEGGFEKVENRTYVAKIAKDSGEAIVDKCSSTDCALMVNLFGSSGLPGPVLKITARGRQGSEGSFPECIRTALHAAYGNAQPVSLGGVFLVKSGKARYHIMPDFPSAPFENRDDVEEWLTFHNFNAPMVCLTVMHSADPGLGLRMEHTHCFAPDGRDAGGHYHNDVESEDGEEIEYEAYFNTAKVIYRIDPPS
nr:hypothetical protein B0A51_16209 [Rachicladosporium sp. CCFEE 5018]